MALLQRNRTRPSESSRKKAVKPLWILFVTFQLINERQLLVDQ